MKKKDFNQGELVAVYTDTSDEWFGLGFVQAIDDDYLVLNGIDPIGDDDGLVLYRIDEIVKIERNTIYCAKIKKLIQIRNISLSSYIVPQKNCITWMLKKAMEEKIIVEIQLLQSGKCDIIGEVKKIDENNDCIIRQINEIGQEDGECQFTLDNISSIKLNSIKGRVLKMLFSTSK